MGKAVGAGAEANARSLSQHRRRFRTATGGGGQALPGGPIDGRWNRRSRDLGGPAGWRADADAAGGFDRSDCEQLADVAHQWGIGVEHSPATETGPRPCGQTRAMAQRIGRARMR